MPRAQAAITVIEAALGVVLLVTLAFVISLGAPGEPTPLADTQLDTYADDAATILVNEQPRHADQTRLAELTASRTRFDREAAAVERRIEAVLPQNVLYRIETAYGTLGHPLPDDVRTGSATVPTTNGEVTVRVWYP